MAASTDADRIASILADHFSFDWERRIVEMLQRASVRQIPSVGVIRGPGKSEGRPPDP
jgi:hypothetical protein